MAVHSAEGLLPLGRLNHSRSVLFEELLFRLFVGPRLEATVRRGHHSNNESQSTTTVGQVAVACPQTASEGGGEREGGSLLHHLPSLPSAFHPWRWGRFAEEESVTPRLLAGCPEAAAGPCRGPSAAECPQGAEREASEKRHNVSDSSQRKTNRTINPLSLSQMIIRLAARAYVHNAQTNVRQERRPLLASTMSINRQRRVCVTPVLNTFPCSNHVIPPPFAAGACVQGIQMAARVLTCPSGREVVPLSRQWHLDHVAYEGHTIEV